MSSHRLEDWEGRIKRGVCRFLLFSALHQRPMHGYEMQRYIRNQCFGLCGPSDAMVYPTLREMLEEGLIQVEAETVSGRERKVYYLTETGREAFRVGAAAWARVLPALQSAVSGVLTPQELAACRGQESPAWDVDEA